MGGMMSQNVLNLVDIGMVGRLGDSALAEPILGVFLTNPETREPAYLPMVLWALLIGFDTTGMVLMNALIGAGGKWADIRI
jgi:Na+-driven multidrug efflux pump